MVEIVASYHELAVWEDPNLAIVLPIIDSYSRGTRFERRVNINPLTLAENCLSFLFFRSDPYGRLARFVDSCGYVSAGNVVLCPLPFLESVLSYGEYTGGDLTPTPVYTVAGDKPAGSEEELSQEMFDLMKTSINALRQEFFLEWILGHEIGHGELGHTSRLSDKGREPREWEEEADRFFIEHIPNPGRATRLLAGPEQPSGDGIRQTLRTGERSPV